jgi:hypothetical protein
MKPSLLRSNAIRWLIWKAHICPNLSPTSSLYAKLMARSRVCYAVVFSVLCVEYSSSALALMYYIVSELIARARTSALSLWFQQTGIFVA